MKYKIRLVLRIAAKHGHRKLVLGALGCGAARNPQKDVARVFREVMQEPEFQGGWWEQLAFAVLDDVSNDDGSIIPEGNCRHFMNELDGKVL